MKTKIFVLAGLSVMVLVSGCQWYRIIKAQHYNPVNTILDDCSSREKLRESIFEEFYSHYDKSYMDSLVFHIYENDTTYNVDFWHADPMNKLLQCQEEITVLKRNCKIIQYERY